MLDVDHFKKFNDTYGHDVGDQVLKMVAGQIRRVGGGGKAFRYGGEEFTIVFPGKDEEHSRPYLEDVREAVADYALVLREKDRPSSHKAGRDKRGQGRYQHRASVTISIGMASRNKNLRDPERVIKAADQALYRAKQAGRNCLVS
jgi:diguanylate cyclase (GGDEF)-like protein